MPEITRQKKIAIDIVHTLQDAGFTAYFAGGCVRDELMGRTPKDFDVATDALPEEVEGLFPKTLALGKAFGVIAVVNDGAITEVATFREEFGTLDGRRPETVMFSAAKEDAIRRDFTINGMFYDPIEHKLLDFVGGQADLEKGIIRSIGNPHERFEEDHLRLLRAVRFAQTLEFSIDPETERAIQKMAGHIQKISIERIEQEFSRMLTESRRPGDGLRRLADLGLLQYIIPEMMPMLGQEQPPQFHPEGDVFEHTELMLNLMADGRQTGKSAPQEGNSAEEHVEQTFQSAHPVEELCDHPFRPIEEAENLQKTHRRLPHWNQNDRIYFVTFRLADSIAQKKLEQWKNELEQWRKNQPDPDSETTLKETTARYRKQQEEWLDKGHGSCLLKNPEISNIVEQTLLHFDGERYQLGDYVIMPNHVHIIVKPLKKHALADIIKSWKGYSAWSLNNHLKEKGSVWMDESFDHIIRREIFFEKYCRYIQDNPKRAFLNKENYRIGTGSLQLSSTTAGQTGKSAPQESNPATHVEQTFQSAHPEGEESYTARELAYTVLLHDVGKPPTASIGPGTDGEPRIRFDGHATVGAEMAEDILRRLKLPKKEIQHIVSAIRGHMRFMDVQKMRASKLRTMIGAEIFDLEMELHWLDCMGSHEMLDNYEFLQSYMKEIANEPVLPEPWLRGHDLIAMGIAEGKLIGKILKDAYDAQMEDQFSCRDELLKWVQQSYQSEQSGN